MAALFFVGLALVAERSSTPRLLQHIGERSFSIYILHFAFVQWFGRHYLQLPQSWQNSGTALVFFLAITTVVYLISSATWSWIEQPLIAMGHRVAARVKESSRAPVAATSFPTDQAGPAKPSI